MNWTELIQRCIRTAIAIVFSFLFVLSAKIDNGTKFIHNEIDGNKIKEEYIRGCTSIMKIIKIV